MMSYQNKCIKSRDSKNVIAIQDCDVIQARTLNENADQCTNVIIVLKSNYQNQANNAQYERTTIKKENQLDQMNSLIVPLGVHQQFKEKLKNTTEQQRNVHNRERSCSNNNKAFVS